jgi:hypothetical protein
MEDIEFVKDLKCHYVCISLPWCHYFSDEWFETWKHRKPNEHLWGKEEHPATATSPKFWIVSVPSVPDENISHLTAQYVQFDTELVVLLQREGNFCIEKLPTEQQTSLLIDGAVVLDTSVFCACVQHKITQNFLDIN